MGRTYHLYKVGDKIYDFTIKEIDFSSVPRKYLMECVCGTKKTVTSQKITRSKRCRNCACREKSSKYIGKRFGRLLVLDNPRINNVRVLLVRCDCSKEYYGRPSAIERTTCCSGCRNGFYPGLSINGCTLIQREEKAKWRMKCKCGNIFIGTPSNQEIRNVTCGCSLRNKYYEKAKNKIGLKYFNLTIVSVSEKPEENHYIMTLRCKCGNFLSCKNGHEFKGKSCGCLDHSVKGERAAHAKYRNFEIKALRDFHDSGQYTKQELSEMYSMDPHYLSRILERKIWKHV